MANGTVSAWLKVDGESIVQSLKEVSDRLATCEGEVVIDFSSVRRIDTGGLSAMDALATRAEERAVKIGLHGINIDVYKVLKLMKLSPRFSFLH